MARAHLALKSQIRKHELLKKKKKKRYRDILLSRQQRHGICIHGDYMFEILFFSR